MRVFITGGMGYVGSHIVSQLLTEGDEVTVLARELDKIPELQAHPGVTRIRGDLEAMDKQSLVTLIKGHDACIHNALIWQEDERELADTRACIRMFEAAAEAKVGHLVYTSSTAVHRPFEPQMTEAARLRTNDLYGATKASNEAFLSAVSHQSDLAFTIVRPGPVVGAPAFTSVEIKTDRRVLEFVSAAQNNETIRVARDSGRQFIGVSDLAKLYTRVLKTKGRGETYLAVAKQATPWEWIASEVLTAVGSGSLEVIKEEEPGFTFDVSRIEREFGFVFLAEPSVSEHIRWLLAQKT